MTLGKVWAIIAASTVVGVGLAWPINRDGYIPERGGNGLSSCRTILYNGFLGFPEHKKSS